MSDPDLVEQLQPIIEETVDRLRHADFRPDPIAGNLFSRITSVMSSAYKRHGNILEAAILTRIASMERYEAHGVDRFYYNDVARNVVNAAMADPSQLDDTHLPYVDDNQLDRLQLDMVVYDRETKIVTSYEIKRGNGAHDANARRGMKRDALTAKVLLKSYAELHGWDVAGSRSYVIFYYGIRGLPHPLGLIGDELNDHFGDAGITDDIEAVNRSFRRQLFEILSQ
ncbi:MAG: hypothetical protein JJ873_12890 [Maricaulis sp.]|uniref:hypothetical protein n=1 Tax=Maricaulis sp. TaxID=1486257 RepID=UPI001B19D1E3|nr:hypothetical protein [Maricaulis sp.]MBO6696997.1 hypothetical protein [Henriciella sp.]MBO6878296.1 hypothetical protein [Maricaulis sp.]